MRIGDCLAQKQTRPPPGGKGDLVERANALAPVHVLWGRAPYLIMPPALVCDDDMTRHVTVDRIDGVSLVVARPASFTVNMFLIAAHGAVAECSA